MNRVYRVVWNGSKRLWQVVSEISRGQGKTKTHSSCRASRTLSQQSALFIWTMPTAALGLAGQAVGAGLPTGGNIVAGSGTISQAGNTMTVTQTTGKMAADWQSFSIGQGSTVNFVQPSAGATALNRVLGADVSVIQGALNANGQVFLVNPNGILFTPTAQVNVGGIVASTLNMSTADFMAGNYKFEGASSNAIINQGNITAVGEGGKGGSIALIAARITNEGRLSANAGNVLLGAGSKVTLDLGGPVKMQVEQGAIDALIEQGGAIKADGGLVYLTAKAAGDLAKTVINHTGVTEAQTLATGEKGQIVLLGGMDKDRIVVGGTLAASAPNGGDGGFNETSAAKVAFVDGVKITTAAPRGETGQWLIDPVDFTIAASGGDITGANLSGLLVSNSVTIHTETGTNSTIDVYGANGANGDIFVNDAVTWNAATKLTLQAHGNININTDITASHANGQVALYYGQGAVASGNTAAYRFRNGAKINLKAGDNFFTKLGSDGAAATWTVITALGSAGSTTGTDLQGMKGNLSKNYALGSDIDAATTVSWNSDAGFDPVGTDLDRFTGNFDGLGHTVTQLNVNRPNTNQVGLFGATNSSNFQNVGIVDGSFSGSSYVGALVGDKASGNIRNSYATSSVSGKSWVGGLVGLSNGGNIDSSYATGAVSGSSQLIGGLIGQARFFGAISNSYATGNVSANTASENVGGLVGQARFVSISNSYATGSVSANDAFANVGGLIGFLDQASISSSYATGNVSAFSAGGLVGGTSGAVAVNNSFWDKETSGQTSSAGGGTGLTTAQMKQPGSFTGWDFNSAWIIYSGQTSPLLRAFMTPLTVTANSVSKTYDGVAYSNSPGVTYSITPNANLLGTVGYSGGAQGALNVGSYSITPSGLYSNQQGYIINYVGGTLTVSPKSLTITGSSAADKVYDGNTSATITAGTLNGLVGGDTLSVSANGTFNSKNVTTANSVMAAYTLLGDTGLASNYSLANETLSAVITPKGLTVSGITASDKTYDGTQMATINVGDALLNGLIGEDSVSVSANGVFDNKNAGSNKLVTLFSSYSGEDVANYAITSQATATASIAQKALTVSGITASDKTYDGTQAAAIDVGSVFLDGLVGEDRFNVSASGAFDNKNAGSNKLVTLSSTYSGEDVGNYVITDQASTTASIAQKALTVSGVTASDKTYDGTQVATVDIGGALFNGLVGEDNVSASGAFDNKNAGSNKLVTLSYSGEDVGNYAITGQTSTTASISQRPITVVADDQAKFFGTADPSLTWHLGAGSLVSGDSLSGSLSRSLGETVGDYTIFATALANGNYQITTRNGVLAINAAPTPTPTPVLESMAINTAISTAQSTASNPAYASSNTTSHSPGSSNGLGLSQAFLGAGGIGGAGNSPVNTSGGLAFVPASSNGAAQGPSGDQASGQGGSGESNASTASASGQGAGRDEFGFMRVSVIDGGINLPSLAAGSVGN